MTSLIDQLSPKIRSKNDFCLDIVFSYFSKFKDIKIIIEHDGHETFPYYITAICNNIDDLVRSYDIIISTELSSLLYQNKKCYKRIAYDRIVFASCNTNKHLCIEYYKNLLISLLKMHIYDSNVLKINKFYLGRVITPLSPVFKEDSMTIHNTLNKIMLNNGDGI